MSDSYPVARCSACRHPVRVLEVNTGFYAVIQHYTLARFAGDEGSGDGINLRCSGSGQIVMKEALL